jgi:hypothetical protein
LAKVDDEVFALDLKFAQGEGLFHMEARNLAEQAGAGQLKLPARLSAGRAGGGVRPRIA